MTSAAEKAAYTREFQEELEAFAQRGKNLQSQTPKQHLSILDLRGFLHHYEGATDMAIEAAVTQHPQTTKAISGVDASEGTINSLDLHNIKEALNKNWRLKEFLESSFRDYFERKHGVQIRGDRRQTPCHKAKLISHVASMLDKTDNREVASQLNSIKATKFVDSFIAQLELLTPGFSQCIATPSGLAAA